MRRIETFDWWPELLEHKDTLSLRELSERFGVTPGAISAAFKRTGTTRRPAPPGPRARRRTGETLPPEPGEGPTHARPGSKDDRILPFAELLGTVPDAEVARQASVSVRTIASFRARHEIQGYAGPRRPAGPGRGRPSKIDAFVDLLGTVPDRVVAERAGVTLNAVRNYRSKHGIAAGGRASAAEGDSAWRVVLESGAGRSVRVVVASSLAEAAMRAESARLGRILALELVGQVI